jgi:hypothetical protein
MARHRRDEMADSERRRNDAVLGGAVIGLAGGAAGFFMGGEALSRVLFVLGGVLIGGFLGVVVAAFGGRRFLLSIVAGAVLGGLLAFYLGGAEAAILGAATGGTIGGFVGVMAGAIGRRF